MFRQIRTRPFSSEPSRRVPGLIATCCAAVVACLAAPASATTWHPDLATARTASLATGRPVLAVFTAAWSGSAADAATATLADPESAALIAACFEPVLIDVDGHQELIRTLRIAHVPSVAVIGDDDVVLAAFEFPESPAAFVAAAARAAQQIAGRQSVPAEPVETPRGQVAVRPMPAAAPVGTLLANTPGAGSPTAPGQPNAQPGGRGSISMVTAKVRELSDFATSGPPSPATPASLRTEPRDFHATPVQPPSSAVAAAPTMPPQFVPTSEPALPTTPPAWPAETPSAPLAVSSTPAQPRPHPAIEPLTRQPAAGSPATAAPWLSSSASPGSAARAEPRTEQPTEGETVASVSDLPGAADTATVPQPASKPSPATAFLAALQKPFAIFAKKPAPAPDVKPVKPPLMSPAWPQWPGTIAAAPSNPPVQTPAQAPRDPKPEAPSESENPMPLGLEGYCPVTLVEKSKWIEGRAQYGVRHRGRTYLFAGVEQQQAFLADPDRYAPRLSGDDPVMALDAGKSTPGQRRYGVFYQSRVYLFATPETRDAFLADKDRYMSRITLAERPQAAESRRL